jgi:hypothetical protein
VQRKGSSSEAAKERAACLLFRQLRVLCAVEKELTIQKGASFRRIV